MKYVLCGSKGSKSDLYSNIIYGSNSKVTITKSNKTELAPQYIYTTAKICNSWHMFNCKKIFKLQLRPPSLILLITTWKDRWIFPSQSWEVRNSMIIIIIIIYCNNIYIEIIYKSYWPHYTFQCLKICPYLCMKLLRWNWTWYVVPQNSVWSNAIN